MTVPQSGPLTGLKVVEFVGIGPGPHCAMLLADLGAEVLRINRPGGNGPRNPVVDRGRPELTLDLRRTAHQKVALDILDRVDILIEGNRPGVMERLGLGPEVVCKRNPRLVYGRITGWGQEGPLAKSAGHDLAYIALTGAVASMGLPDAPSPVPLNLVGDFGGGSLYLAFGIMTALWERQKSGEGQIVDAAILDGTMSLMAMFQGFGAAGLLSMNREENFLAGSAPFYRCYFTADGKQMAVSAVEPHFYELLLKLIGAPAEWLEDQLDHRLWASRSEAMAKIFASKDRDEWASILEGTDACCAAVLELEEASRHPQMIARQAFIEHDGILQSAPAPRFSRTPGMLQSEPDARTMLSSWGLGQLYSELI